MNYASSKTGADTVVAAITAAGGKAVAVGATSPKLLRRTVSFDAAIKNYGRLDILVNKSGVYEFTRIEAITEDQFQCFRFEPRFQNSRDALKVANRDSRSEIREAIRIGNLDGNFGSMEGRYYQY